MKVISADFHRNGVSGVPFRVAIVENPFEVEEQEGRTFLVVTMADEDGDYDRQATAVFAMDKLAEGEIRFFYNSWRGDRVTEATHKAIAETIEAKYEYLTRAEVLAMFE